MAKILPLSILGLLVCSTIKAQVDPIDTDRPDQTESAYTVPKNYFQAEIGFNKENTFYKNYDLVLPTALLKYGFKKWELRLEVTSRSSYEHLIPDPKWTNGLEPVEIGFKAALWEEKKWIPKTSIIAHLGLPTVASRVFRAHHIAPSFRFTMQNSLTKNIAVGYNLGAEWDGFSSTPIWIYTLAPGFELGEKWYAYIEAFGFIQKNEPAQHNIDGGIAYYISRDVKIDASSGFGISDAAPKNYFALGISFRVDTRRGK
jgi:Putative MetA-pathway of phenol degradation